MRYGFLLAMCLCVSQAVTAQVTEIEPAPDVNALFQTMQAYQTQMEHLAPFADAADGCLKQPDACSRWVGEARPWTRRYLAYVRSQQLHQSGRFLASMAAVGEADEALFSAAEDLANTRDPRLIQGYYDIVDNKDALCKAARSAFEKLFADYRRTTW